MLNEGSRADLWSYDLQRGSKTRLTDGKSVYSYPVWSPDGQYVVFSSSGGMFWTRADGSGRPHPLTVIKALQFPTSFTPDGKRFFRIESRWRPHPDGASGPSLWAVARESSGVVPTNGVRSAVPGLLVRWTMARVRAIEFDGMRHTSATLLFQAGVPVKVIQERLGHKRIEITLGIYAHVLPSMQQDAAARLGALLKG
jgi:hypothetical protein